MANTSTGWLQVKIITGDLDPCALGQFFESQGALSVTFQDAADQPLFEPEPGATPLWLATRIIALFDEGLDSDGLRQQIVDAFGLPAADRLAVERLENRDWERVWLDDFKPMSFGKRLWVCPAGQRPEQDDAVIVDLDPGLAFGTGTHPTTALCLAWLDQHPPRQLEVLDYGCGSGVLAIAALKLGAARVCGVDIDTQALTASRQNAVRNRVESRLQTLLPDDLAAAYRADLVLANILANPLIEMAASLAGRVKPGGKLVLSGILAEQAEQVMAVYARYLQMEDAVEQEGWVQLAGNKV